MRVEFLDVKLSAGGSNALSNNNLTVVNTGHGGVRSTHGKTSGKWYWEIRYDAGNYFFDIGISNTSFRISSSVDKESKDWRGISMNTNYGNTRISKHPGNGLYANNSWVTVGTIIGVAMDLDNGVLEFYNNGVIMGASHTDANTIGEVYPTFSAAVSNTKTVTFNFGAKPFTYKIPDGYRSYNTEIVFDNKILLSSGDKYYSASIEELKDVSSIPIMTSNTIPSGIASESSFVSSDSAWKAFDGIGTTGWNTGTSISLPAWIAYDFKESKMIGKYSVSLSNPSYAPRKWVFQGTYDSITWVDLDDRENITFVPLIAQTFTCKKIGVYKKYRLYILNGATDGRAYISELQMFEHQKQIIELSSYIERNHITHGMNSMDGINLKSSYYVKKKIELDNNSLGSGKTYEHTVDMSKRRVDKITLGE